MTYRSSAEHHTHNAISEADAWKQNVLKNL